MVLEELGLTYDPIFLNFAENQQKSPEHLKLNANGRPPTLVDHYNNDFVVWYVSVLRKSQSLHSC